MNSISEDSVKEITIIEPQTEELLEDTVKSVETPETQIEMISQEKVKSEMKQETQKEHIPLEVIKAASPVPSICHKQQDLLETNQNIKSEVDPCQLQEVNNLVEDMKSVQHVSEKIHLMGKSSENQLITKQLPEAYQNLIEQIRTATPNSQNHQKSLRLLTKTSNPIKKPHMIVTLSPEDPHNLMRTLSRRHLSEAPLSVKEITDQNLSSQVFPKGVIVPETIKGNAQILPFLPSLISPQCAAIPPPTAAPLVQHLPKIPGSS